MASPMSPASFHTSLPPSLPTTLSSYFPEICEYAICSTSVPSYYLLNLETCPPSSLLQIKLPKAFCINLHISVSFCTPVFYCKGQLGKRWQCWGEKALHSEFQVCAIKSITMPCLSQHPKSFSQGSCIFRGVPCKRKEAYNHGI